MVNSSAFALQKFPSSLLQPKNSALFTDILRGIEKESLRVTSDGRLALTSHPIALGSALAHPQITTDFSEALLEFITPPSNQISELLAHLNNSHQFTYQHLGEELLWVNSMPCMIGDPNSIPVAVYGSSNRAKMKSIYRVGLGNRYGRTMQTVAGVHFNFSLPQSFWELMYTEEGAHEPLESFTTRRYFDLIRNFRRYYWLLIYLFGSSPALCRSFVKGREHTLQPFGADEHTLYRPYATSLRMGDLGYQSSAQESLFVCYNSRDSYVRTLSRAIATPYPPYQALGVKNSGGDYMQLNTSLLQIENEFYSAIRPKRTAHKAETALTALCQRGVEYVEVRCLDLDPYSPLGVTEEQIRFLDTFLVYCAIQDSPKCDGDEFAQIAFNQKRVVNEGRKPGLTLKTPQGEEMELKHWAEMLCKALKPVAEMLDGANNSGALYRSALQNQQRKVDDVSLTPSARILSDLQDQNLTFAQWAKQRALFCRNYFAELDDNSENNKNFSEMAKTSLESQKAEELLPQRPFDDYLETYYEQYRQCDRTTHSVDQGCKGDHHS